MREPIGVRRRCRRLAIAKDVPGRGSRITVCDAMAGGSAVAEKHHLVDLGHPQPGAKPRLKAGLREVQRWLGGCLAVPAMRILLVEDDLVSAQVARDILGHLGHRVGDARSGAEALSAARADRFEAAVVDVGLPDADGFALVEELRRLQPGLRCVVVTGQFIPDAESRAGRIGAGFRCKPLDYRELADWLTASG
jgi:CheY-like chemotaxis protein